MIAARGKKKGAIQGARDEVLPRRPERERSAFTPLSPLIRGGETPTLIRAGDLRFLCCSTPGGVKRLSIRPLAKGPRDVTRSPREHVFERAGIRSARGTAPNGQGYQERS